MKTPIKAASAPVTNKAIQVAKLLLKADAKANDLLIEVFGSVMRAADHKQFKIVKKSLVLSINAKQGWDFTSLDAIYKDGFGCGTVPNKISMISYFIQMKPTLDFNHVEVVEQGFSAVAKVVEDARKEAREAPANDDNAHQDEAPASAEEHDAVIKELAESSANEVEPVRKQLADLAMTADIDIVTELVRMLIDAKLNQEEAA